MSKIIKQQVSIIGETLGKLPANFLNQPASFYLARTADLKNQYHRTYLERTGR